MNELLPADVESGVTEIAMALIVGTHDNTSSAVRVKKFDVVYY